MTTERNVTATRRLIDEGFTQGRLDVCDEVVAPESVEHQHGLQPGSDGAKATIRTLHAAFSEFELSIVDLIANDDMVWIRNRAAGVHTGTFMGRPATGRRFEATVFDVMRFEDGRIVEHWGVPDQLGILMQLGLIDRPEPVPVG